MQAILSGGPFNNRRIQVMPGTMTHRVPIPRPVSIFEPFDVSDMSSNYDVAEYKFSGYGVVTAFGACKAIILSWEQTYSG